MQVMTSTVAFFKAEADMRTHIRSRRVTCDQDSKISDTFANFKMEAYNSFKKKSNDSSPDEGYETPSKKPFCPTTLSPDLGCVMDYSSPPARPVVFRKDWEREKRWYIQSVTDHMNERPGSAQGVMSELLSLITSVGDKTLSSGKPWQHPADFTRRNYKARFVTTAQMALCDWQAKNLGRLKRFARVPKCFERSPVL